jgi:hypothetical protein
MHRLRMLEEGEQTFGLDYRQAPVRHSLNDDAHPSKRGFTLANVSLDHLPLCLPWAHSSQYHV